MLSGTIIFIHSDLCFHRKLIVKYYSEIYHFLLLMCKFCTKKENVKNNETLLDIVFNRVFTYGWKTGFEPATSGTTIQRSNQLSYNHRVIADANVIYFTSFAKKNSIFFKEYHLTRSHPTIALQ